MRRGIWYAVGAYLLWGLFPVYWKLLVHVPATQLIGHRIVWSFATLAVIILLSARRPADTVAWSWQLLRIYGVAAVLITINWFTYVWAVNSGFVVETSLGYFINPLVSVALGVVVLREQLRPIQWIAIALAASGVVYLTVVYGALPRIALVLAFSFGTYGLVKKTAPLGSVRGLALETAILLPIAIAYLFRAEHIGQGALFHDGWRSDVLLAGTGLVTTVPLLLFASAAQRIPLSTMGVLQYIAPTMQLLLGVLVYREPFTSVQLVGFSMVWAALLIMAGEGLLTRRPAPSGALLDEGAG